MNSFERHEELLGITDLVDKVSDRVLPHGLARAVRHLRVESDIAAANLAGRLDLETNPPELQDGLHVGCGSNILPGYTNLDIFPAEGVDVVCDAREGLPFVDDQFGTVFAEHMLEHVDYPRSVKKILDEMVRVVRPQGSVVIGVPDSSIPVLRYADGDQDYFNDLAKRWYSGRRDIEDYTTPIQFVRLVMADVDDDPSYTPHLVAYDEDTLQGLMEDAGLENVGPWEFDDSIGLEKRRWGSIYLEGAVV